MTKHRRRVANIGLIILVGIVGSLAGFTSPAKSDQLTGLPPLLYESLAPETQEISSTETLLDVAITEEGMFPPVVWITPGATIRWTNQTSQTQRLDGSRTDSDPDFSFNGQTIFLPLIFKEANGNQNNLTPNGNPADNSNPTDPKTTWQSGDIAPGDSFTYVFDQFGYYVYTLAGSPTLTGMVIVEQPAMALATFSVLTVNATTDDRINNKNCTLREAIIAANTNKAVDACPAGSTADTIVLGNGTYSLTFKGQGEDAAATGDLDITSNITITGAGNTIIDAKNLSDRVFHILSKGKLTLSGVTISNGQGFGGGIYNKGALTLNRVVISSNKALANDLGGGISNDGQATIKDSAISGNSAGLGAGIFNRGILNLNNSTVSGNTAGDTGGGIKNEGTLTLKHNTISNNTAQHGGGVINFYFGTVKFQNSIIAGNTSPSDSSSADCNGFSSGSLGYNLVGVNTGCPTIGTDLKVNPATVFTTVLGPLQDNGGGTLTHALLSGSPAIDAIPPDKCLFNADQRGIARPQGAACEIGSFEFEDIHIFTVNSAADTADGKCDATNCTLREAINAANAHPNGAVLDEIRFNIPGDGLQTIQLASALPSITGPVALDGTTQPGASCNPLNLLIALNGANAGPNAAGLNITGGGTTVRGLIISGFSSDGIQLSGNGNNIIRCNTITANGGSGVQITSSSGNAIGGTGILTDVNRIFDNTGLGIDLGGDGVTPNDTGTVQPPGFDPDAGANNLQNFPLMASAIPDNGDVQLDGLLKSTANSPFTLEFFANSTCDPSGSGEGQNFLGATAVTTNENGNATFSGLPFTWADSDGRFITAIATDANGNTSEYSECVLVNLANISWPRALPLTLNGNPGSATFEQLLDQQGQSRWFRFRIQPNSKVIVTLTNLPANYDLTIYKDISAAFNELNSPQDLLRLNAEFAPDAFAFDAFAPGSRSPDSFAPGSRSPDAFAPAAFSATAFAPGSRSPDAFAPGSRSPDIFAPDAFSADAFAPGSRSPDDIAPGSRSEDFFEAFASAQLRSLIGVSAFDGTVGEGIIVNTWNNTGDFYVRVKGRDGAFSLAAPFRLQVTLQNGSCGSVNPNLTGNILNASAGNFRTLILTDLGRMTGDPDLTTLQTRLATLSARPEVAGVVVDVGADGRVAAFNAQADANVTCPYAKNLVADAIKDIVDRYRALNPLQYVVIVGNDDVIPFFRYPDNSLLGPESEYVPPVRDTTASQASLRLNYVLSQDAYGSAVDISLKVSEFPIPGLAVGRLVERAADIVTLLDTYLSTPNGVITPNSALVTGYDFFADAAQAIQTELQAGTGATADALITAAEVSPQDPTAWTANQLRTQLLGRRHDLVFLGGHFSANSALAADYSTRLVTTDLGTSTILSNAIIFSIGCHSGYNIVNPHGIPDVTREPDWAQAFAQKGATLIAGTGYQYGDTDFIEYDERIYLEFSRQLRLGSGPVSIGQALVASKRVYLAQTPELRGLHEKSLLEPTLFGLPMLSVNMPAGRITSNGESSIVGTPTTFSTNPGAALGLRSADIAINPSLTEQTVPLVNTEGGPNVQARYLQGSDGVVTHPLEPTLPLEMSNVSVANLVLRGVGFRGGSYADTNFPASVVPLTGAPATEIRGVHSTFLSDIFYPIQPWSVNYLDALAGGATRLAVTPAQHRVSSPGSQTTTLRRFNSLNFRLYYSNNISPTNVGTTTVIPALAAAPSIAGISATPSGGTVSFRINVVGDPTAGIQEVWVTYTGVSGPLAGTWQSLNLTQNSQDSTLWEGAFSLNGTPAQDIRYMVQAVNGVGLVSLATNVGAYYIPGVDPTQLQATTLSLGSLASPGRYGITTTVSAVLTSNGGPLANRVITLGLGPSSRQAVTDANGRATATLTLLGIPGQYQVTASFAGTASEAPASATSTGTFEIIKQSTNLSLNPSPATGHPGDNTLMVATLTDGTGRRLPEQTVFFVVTGSGVFSTSVSVITDYLGRAPLGNLSLPPGTYTVKAYFSGTISLSNGNTVILNNDRYEPSTVSASLTLTDICEQILDNFNLPDGGLSSTNWGGSRSGYSIVSQQVKVGQGGPIYWKPTIFGPNQVACVKLIKLDPTSPFHAVMLKVQSLNNYNLGAILVNYNAVTGNIDVEVRKDGNWLPAGSFTPPAPVQEGDRLGAKALANGQVELYINNTLVGVAEAGSFYANKGGQIGLWFHNVHGAIIDDFAGGNISNP